MRLRGPSSRAGKGNPVAIRTTFQTACRTAGLKDRTAAKHWPCVCGHVYAAHRCVRFTPGGENVLAAELLDPALLAGLLFGTTTVLQANLSEISSTSNSMSEPEATPSLRSMVIFSTQDVSAPSRSAFGRFGPKNS